MKRGDDSKVNSNRLSRICRHLLIGSAQPGSHRALYFGLQETSKLPHRLIEKKRRDRINECIAQLKDLLPEHLKLTVLLQFLHHSANMRRAARKSLVLRLDDKYKHVFQPFFPF